MNITDLKYNFFSGTGGQKRLFATRLDTVGDSSGEDDMSVDGSSTEQIFRIKPAATEILRIARVILYVEDAGSFDATRWGNGITMTNGMEFRQISNGETIIGEAIRTTGDMAALCHDIGHQTIGSGPEFMTARYTFTKLGAYVRLDGSKGDEWQTVIRDNLTNLLRQHVTAEGYYEKQ